MPEAAQQEDHQEQQDARDAVSEGNGQRDPLALVDEMIARREAIKQRIAALQRLAWEEP
jgi:hypothetical protein